MANQNWNDEIRKQLDNLASFPAKDEWKLGEWIEQCHVRPEVADFASLPVTGNQPGDARIVLADQAWYIWDGSAWQQMTGGGGGAVNSVTASAPITSSGGANPNIVLSGVVGVVHGGTGAANIPANSVVLGNGTSAVQTVAPGAPGNVLASNGVTWQSVALPTSVASVTASAPLASSGGTTPNVSLTGVVSTTNGGTGLSSLTPGAVLFGDGTNPVGTDGGQLFWDKTNDRLGIGNGAPAATLSVGDTNQFLVDANGNILRIHDVPYNWPNVPGGASTFLQNDGSGNLAWTTIAAGGVTSVAASSPLSVSGPAATPTVNLTGIVPVANGGTGQTSYTDGQLLIGNSTGNTLTKAPLTGTARVTITNGPGSITIDAPGALGGTVTSVGLSTTLSGITVGGTPVTGSGTLSLGGTLGATSGGTGQTSYAVGDLLYANTTTSLSKLADVATGNVLLSGGVGVAPAYGKVGLTTHVTGTLPVGNGGTGRSSLTANNVLVGNGTGLVQLIAPGASGDVLTWNGTNWLSAPPTGGGGGVTSVTASAPVVSSGGAFPNISLTAGTNPNDVLTWNGSAWVSSPPSGGGVASVTASAPLASSGGATPDISLTGVVPVANGGTGQSALPLNSVVLGNGTSAVQTVAPGAANNVLTSNGTTWQSTAPLVSSVSGSGGTTGLTLTGGPTGAVTLTLGGTLDVDNGGTGQTSYTDGQLLIGNSTGNTLTKAPLTGTARVTITNGPGSITIDAPGALGGTVTSVGLSTTLSGITVGGTPVTGSGTLSLGGTLGATSGGTGQTSYAVGDLLYANTTTSLSKLADVATGNVLLSGGVGVAPSYGKVGLTTHVSGVLPLGNGGTGQSSTPTNGQVLIGNGTGFTLNTLTQGSGISITNTAGGITITNTAPGTSTPPAGSNTQIQYNNSGAFGANSALTFNATTSTFTSSGTNNLGASGLTTTINGSLTTNPGSTDSFGITGQANSNLYTYGASNPTLYVGAQGNLTLDSFAQARLGVTDATAVNIGRSSVTTTINGSLTTNPGSTDSFGITGQANSNLYTYGASNPTLYVGAQGSLTLDSFAQVRLGAFDATSVSIGRSGITTTINGNLSLAAPLTAANGGTGQSSYAVGDLLYASTTSALSKLADVATGNALLSGGVGVAPAYGKVGLTTHVSGTLPVANGGTGAATLTGYVKGNGTSAFTASATVAGSDVSGNISGNAANVTGTVAVTNGGTGTSSAFTSGSVVFAGASGVYSQNNSNLFWDNTNNRLGIGTSSPSDRLTVAGGLTQSSGVFSLTGNAASTLSTSAGNITINPAARLNLGTATTTNVDIGYSTSSTRVQGNFLVALPAADETFASDATGTFVDGRPGTPVEIGYTNANSVLIGRSGITTTVTGGLTQNTGVFSLTGNGTSSISVTSGNLTLSTAASPSSISILPAAALNLGTSTTALIAIGRSGMTSTVQGNFSVNGNGTFTLTGNAASTLSTSAGNITITPAATLNLGTATTTGVSIGRSGITTTITGALTQTGGAFSLAGSASSSVTTSSQLTLGTTSANSIVTQTNSTNRLQISSTGQYIFNGIGSGSGTTAVLTTIGNELLKLSSSLRYKTAVEPLPTAISENVLNLRPISYKSTCASDDKDQIWYGLIAEEVEQVEPRLVHYTKDPEDDTKLIPDGVQYDRVSVLLLDVVKRQKTKLDALEQALQALQAEVAALKGQG